MVRRLLVLNGLAILGVVLYHATGWGFVAMFWWTDRYLPVDVPNFAQLGSGPYYALRLTEQLIIFCIPAFLFVSGFFVAIATPKDSTPEWKLVGLRVRNLAIPYLLWSVSVFFSDFLQGTTYSAAEYIRRLAFGRAMPAFYYVPLLCQLYAVSPLLVPAARTRWKPLLLVAALIQLTVQALRYPVVLATETSALESLVALTPNWFVARGIFWFTFGIVVGFNREGFKLLLSRIKGILLPALVVLFLLGVLEWEILLHLSGHEWVGPRETIIDFLYAGAFILCFLAFDSVSVPLPGRLGDLGTKSFGVYLVHSQVLELASRLTYHTAPWLLASQALFQPLLVALGLGIPLLLMAAVNRSPARGLYGYLFG